jgi:hypothetical protein
VSAAGEPGGGHANAGETGARHAVWQPLQHAPSGRLNRGVIKNRISGSAAHDVLGPAHRVRRVDGEDPADDEPVEQQSRGQLANQQEAFSLLR